MQGLVQTGLYRILFYSGFSLDRFIQDSVLFMVWFRQVIQDSVLFRVQFRQVYKGFCFIQGLVQTGLYRILLHSGFSLDRFIQDSALFRAWFRQVYAGFCFIQGLAQTGLYRILFYSGFGLDRFIQDSVLFRVWFRQFSLYDMKYSVLFTSLHIYYGSFRCIMSLHFHTYDISYESPLTKLDQKGSWLVLLIYYICQVHPPTNMAAVS